MDGWTDILFLNKIKGLQRPPQVDERWTGWTAAATGPDKQTQKRLPIRGVTSQHGVHTPLQAFDLHEKELQREVIILTH